MPDASLPPMWKPASSPPSLGLLVQADDVDGHAEGGPDVVVVHARGHDVDEHVLGLQLRNRDDFVLERGDGVAEAVLADHLRVHTLRDDAEGRPLCHVENVFRGSHGQGQHSERLNKSRGIDSLKNFARLEVGGRLRKHEDAPRI